MTLLKLFIACTFLNRELGYCKSNYNNYTENIISLNTDVAELHSFAIKRLQATNRVTIKDNNFYHRYSFYNILTYFPIMKDLNLFCFEFTTFNYNFDF